MPNNRSPRLKPFSEPDQTEALDWKAQFCAPKAEISLIACLIGDSSHLPGVLSRLTLRDFTNRSRVIFNACLKLRDKGVVVDRVTLAAQLNATHATRLCGPISFESLGDSAIPAWKIEEYVRLIQDYGRARAYLDLVQEILVQITHHQPPLRCTLGV